MVAAVAGAGRSVGLIMSKIGVALWKPGQVERGMERGTGKGHDVFRPGEHDGRITPRVNELAEMLLRDRWLAGHRQSLGRALVQAVAELPWAIPYRP